MKPSQADGKVDTVDKKYTHMPVKIAFSVMEKITIKNKKLYYIIYVFHLIKKTRVCL